MLVFRGIARSIALLFALLPAIASAATVKQPPLPVGNWYGEGQPWSGRIIWLAHIWPGGRFELEARACLKGKTLADDQEWGHWSYSKGIMDIVTATVNGRPAPREDTYKTQSYDGRKHVYKHDRTGFVFTGVRVAESFELPSCNLSS
jgi:hypothetical protein